MKTIHTLIGASAIALTAGLASAQTDITVAIQLEPPNLDPTGGAAQAIDSVLYSNVFEGLTRFMADGSVVAGLAESWDISPDGLTYTFNLRSGVTFHDGTAMDAEDVKFSLDRARAEDSTNAQKGLFAGIADVAVVDPQTVAVTLNEPNGSFLFNMAWGDAVIVAPESIADIASNPIGTGAFKFDEWVQGDRIEMSRNDAYWGDAPAPHAIDRQAIIDGAMFGYGTPIGTHFAPHNPDYVDMISASQYDPELAKQLLADAGFADGFTTTLKLPPPSYARRGGEIIAAQLREVGITAEITNLEWAQWLEEVFKAKDFGLSIVSHTEPMDIGIYANPDYYFQYDNPKFQALMEELTATTDPAGRSAILAEAQAIIALDYVNGYLFELAVSTVAKAELNGLWLNQPTAAVDLTGVSWSE